MPDFYKSCYLKVLTSFCAVCPVNWKPGKASIKPDSKKSASFFTETYHLDGPMEGSK